MKRKNNPYVHELWRYPIKGMPGEKVETLSLQAYRWVEGDRILGLWFKKNHTSYALLSSFDMPKDMHLWKVRWQDQAMCVSLRSPCESNITIPSSGAFLEKTILNKVLGKDMIHARRGHFGYADRKALIQRGRDKGKEQEPQHYISIINLESLHALETQYGEHFQHQRFRANMVLAKWRPFEEQKSMGKIITIGSASLRIVAPIKRCPVINKDPKTGQTLINILPHLPDQHMGVYAQIITTGSICTQDLMIGIN